jgi:methyl-accepting chemotaxis protein
MFVLGGLFGAESPAFSQSSPPPSKKAREVEALVNRAAALIDSKGKAAFVHFRLKDSEWFHGDTYLFVYDLKSNVLLNPAFPAREGTTVSEKDPMASHFTKTGQTENEGSGWVHYMFPGQISHPERPMKAGKSTEFPAWLHRVFIPISHCGIVRWTSFLSGAP